MIEIKLMEEGKDGAKKNVWIKIGLFWSYLDLAVWSNLRQISKLSEFRI